MSTNSNPPRYLEVIDAVGDRVAVTVAPHTGRVTLKIPKAATQKEREIYNIMACRVVSEMPDPALTARGAIKNRLDNYELALQISEAAGYFKITEPIRP